MALFAIAPPVQREYPSAGINNGTRPVLTHTPTATLCTHSLSVSNAAHTLRAFRQQMRTVRSWCGSR